MINEENHLRVLRFSSLFHKTCVQFNSKAVSDLERMGHGYCGSNIRMKGEQRIPAVEEEIKALGRDVENLRGSYTLTDQSTRPTRSCSHG